MSILDMVPTAAEPMVTVPFIAFCKKRGGTVSIRTIQDDMATLKDGPMKALANGSKVLLASISLWKNRK